MALRSLMQLRGLLEGLPGGSMNIAPTDIQNNTPPQEIIQGILLAGDNIFPVPALAVGMVIIFDPTSTTVKTLKGGVADTGIVLSNARWNVIGIGGAFPVTFIINSSLLDTKYTTIIFF